MRELLPDDLQDFCDCEDEADEAGGEYLNSIGVFSIKEMTIAQWRIYFRTIKHEFACAMYVKVFGEEIDRSIGPTIGDEGSRLLSIQERCEAMADEAGGAYLNSIKTFNIKDMTRDQWRIYFRQVTDVYSTALTQALRSGAPF